MSDFPGRREFLRGLTALPLATGTASAGESAELSQVGTKELNRPYNPIEAAYAVSQYIDFDPDLWLSACALANVPINGVDGWLGIGFSFGRDGQRIDNGRARFLAAWLGIADDARAATSEVLALLAAREARTRDAACDPIFMAIDTHRSARAKMQALGETAPDNDPEYEEAEQQETDLWRALIKVEPCSLAGAAAFAAYVADYPEDEIWPKDRSRALETLHRALQQMHAAHVEA